MRRKLNFFTLKKTYKDSPKTVFMLLPPCWYQVSRLLVVMQQVPSTYKRRYCCAFWQEEEDSAEFTVKPIAIRPVKT